MAGTIRRRMSGLLVLALTVTGVGVIDLVRPPAAHATGPSVVTVPFGYAGATTTWTVPANVTQITLTVTGAEGGRGGADSAGPSPAGGYQGVVTGTIVVTPGQVFTIAVGSGGRTGTSSTHSGNTNSTYLNGASVGGSNPLGSNGGNGGNAGQSGSSGNGGAGGAASMVQINGQTIVAGGSGGAGGSGQFAPTLGRVSSSTHTPRPDTTSAVGQTGISVFIACQAPGSTSCDGGGSGGGGGGVQGGKQGDDQFGSGTSNEWYGYGGFPGQNSTANIGGLSALYQYYADDNANGSVLISYAAGAPDVPTGVAGVADNGAADLSWLAPVNVGQSGITDYVIEYSSNGTTWTTFNDGTSTSTATTVTGLSNGTAYTFRVSAVNTVGAGSASAVSSPVTPSGLPAAPSITAITPGDASLAIAFTPGTSSASPAPIVDYAYQINGAGPWISNGGVTSSPITIGGLANGTSYSVQIRAVSGIGAGAASNSATSTPRALPGAPTITGITTGPATAAIAFSPGYGGGGTITDYEYQLNGAGAWISASSITSPLAIASLASGTAYTVAIRAHSLSGSGTASQTSNFTTPAAPGAPAPGSITRGDGMLSIPFTPGSPGGATITSYQYSLDSGANWITAPSLSSPIVVTGLTNGATYGVQVRAVSAVGSGAASATQNATPATAPSAPSILGNTVAGSNATLTATFVPPASDGGSAITNYQYSTDSGASWQTVSPPSTSSPIQISALSNGGGALSNGTTYYVELRAVNAVGAGGASAVATGLVATVPDAPILSTVTSGSQSLQVAFTTASNGGAEITGYQYSLDNGAWTDTGTLGSAFTLTGLTNGAAYSVRVRAGNSQGASGPSNSISATPASAPGQPSITAVARGDQSLVVSASDASDGGAAITGWQASTDGGATWLPITASDPLTITSLSSNGATPISNGTSYPIAVRAVNVMGVSLASDTTSVGPGAAPSAPTVTLTAQSQSLSVSFSAGSNGGSPVTALEYRLGGNAGAWTDAGTLASPFTISGLTNGTSYSVQVRQDNAIGAGAASTAAPATPLTPPGAPTSVTAVSNSESADVTWTATADNGGSAVTGYTATAYPSASSSTPVGTACATATLGCSITALTDGAPRTTSLSWRRMRLALACPPRRARWSPRWRVRVRRR